MVDAYFSSPLTINMFYYYFCHVLLCRDNLEHIILINIEFNGRVVPGPYFRPICSPAGKCWAGPWFRLAAGPGRPPAGPGRVLGRPVDIFQYYRDFYHNYLSSCILHTNTHRYKYKTETFRNKTDLLFSVVLFAFLTNK